LFRVLEYMFYKMNEMKELGYPSEKGRVYAVNSGVDIDYLRIALDLNRENFLYMNNSSDSEVITGQYRFVLLDGRILEIGKMQEVLDSLQNPETTFFCFADQKVSGKEDMLDLSEFYNTPFRIYAEASIRKTYRKSPFFSSEQGSWNLARTAFGFPHSSASLEEEFIHSISSSRDILTCYDQVRGFTVVRVD
jgi:hypothetical protein